MVIALRCGTCPEGPHHHHHHHHPSHREHPLTWRSLMCQHVVRHKVIHLFLFCWVDESSFCHGYLSDEDLSGAFSLLHWKQIRTCPCKSSGLVSSQKRISRAVGLQLQSGSSSSGASMQELAAMLLLLWLISRCVCVSVRIRLRVLCSSDARVAETPAGLHTPGYLSLRD